MTYLTTFNYLSNTVRVIEIDSQPWFVAADVCRALEMDTTNGTYRWLKGLDPDEKRVIHREDYPQKFCGFRGMSLTLLSEPGIYKLTARSSKPEAKAFDRWVRHEVLPAIRKDGMYVAGEEKVKTGEMSDLSDAEVLATRRGYNEVNTHRFRQALDEKQITHIVGVGNGGTGQDASNSKSKSSASSTSPWRPTASSSPLTVATGSNILTAR